MHPASALKVHGRRPLTAMGGLTMTQSLFSLKIAACGCEAVELKQDASATFDKRRVSTREHRTV
jgi:hypothetical protein